MALIDAGTKSPGKSCDTEEPVPEFLSSDCCTL